MNKNSERERGTQVQKGKMNKYLSIITLNVNGLNDPIKRHKVAEWVRKHDQYICCLQETHLRKKRPTQTESESLENKYSKLAESTVKKYSSNEDRKMSAT